MKIYRAFALFLSLFLAREFLAAETKSTPNAPERLILIIGDGMGFEALGLLRLYFEIEKKKPSNFELALSQGNLTLMQPRPREALVIDSACSITEIACAVDALPETLGLDEDGNVVETIAERAKKRGLSVGIVSDTRLTNATPAGFAAHIAHRSSENVIAEQMLKSSFDVMLSGGLQHFVPAEVNSPTSPTYLEVKSLLPTEIIPRSSRDDNLNLLSRAQALGYNLVFDQKQLANSQKLPLLGLFAKSVMQDAIEESIGKSSQPTLAEMTEKTLSLLESNPRGFFAMIEAGQIDWAEHSNDAGLLLHEMLRFDKMVGVVLSWLQRHPETTVVITADHSTGGFGFSYRGDDIPAARPFKADSKMMYAPKHNFGDPKMLSKLVAQPLSFVRFFKEFSSLNPGLDNAALLRKLVAEKLNFDISEAEASEILQQEHKPGAKDTMWPKMHDFSAFYPGTRDRRPALLARILSAQTGIVWSSGGHTSTPVPFLVLGRAGSVPRSIISAKEAGEFLRLNK